MKLLLAVVTAYLYGCHVGLTEGRKAGIRVGHYEASTWFGA